MHGNDNLRRVAEENVVACHSNEDHFDLVMVGNFNPFKKSTTPSSVSRSGGGRSGIVFDEMVKKDVVKSVGKAKTSFGDRKKLAEANKQLTGSSK